MSFSTKIETFSSISQGNRKFTDLIGWKKDISFTAKTHGLVKYDRPYIGYNERKIDIASKVNDYRLMVNYDRPRSSTQER